MQQWSGCACEARGLSRPMSRSDLLPRVLQPRRAASVDVEAHPHAARVDPQNPGGRCLCPERRQHVALAFPGDGRWGNSTNAPGMRPSSHGIERRNRHRVPAASGSRGRSTAAEYLASTSHEAPVWIGPRLQGETPSRMAGSLSIPPCRTCFLRQGRAASGRR
jgi:hypothetical protein